ncbi:hypothetical protein NEOLEDRAFT_216816 [Neolentinus lepideus HHB14362 ss-1]|uniref:Uncharacterized protein n=1 Tax=Neolentinus lepideus HHB14362 ss-1 TaxID=1314782 RepID=A0A165MBZ6_9AGAM|nr:hypothetical protein NEOLEDRAFT_216816 [Neolentinus lepideus HHB14362 ss-1]
MWSGSSCIRRRALRTFALLFRQCELHTDIDVIWGSNVQAYGYRRGPGGLVFVVCQYLGGCGGGCLLQCRSIDHRSYTWGWASPDTCVNCLSLFAFSQNAVWPVALVF